MLTLLFASLSVPALAATPVTTPDADPLVTISWGDGTEHTTRVEVALPPEHTCAKLDIDEPSSVLKLGVCRTGGDASAPVLEIAVERMRRPGVGLPNDSSTAKLRATVQLRRGGLVHMGRFQQADHPEEVTVQLH